MELLPNIVNQLQVRSNFEQNKKKVITQIDLFLASNSATAKLNNGQRFVCPCGRSFSAEITIRETTNVDASSPPATPMLSLKTDLKYQQHSQESISKRARVLMIDPPQPTTTTITTLNTSSLITSWPTTNMKTYEHSPGRIYLFFD
jgi:hypothetical protein